MTGKTLLNKTGLRSLETYYEPIMNTDFGSVVAYRTSVRINDPDMGVLLPDIYLPVAERTTLANRVSLWAIDDISLNIPKFKNRGAYFEFITVYIPFNLLTSDDFCSRFLKYISDNGTSAEDVCIEVSSSIFTYDTKTSQRSLLKFTENGIKTMLSDFGRGCAFIGRLEEFRFNYVMLDSILSANLISDDERKISMANSVFDLISAQDSIPIATGVRNLEIQRALPKSCVNFTGSRAGRMKKAASIR